MLCYLDTCAVDPYTQSEFQVSAHITMKYVYNQCTQICVGLQASAICEHRPVIFF